MTDDRRRFLGAAALGVGTLSLPPDLAQADDKSKAGK